MNKLLIM